MRQHRNCSRLLGFLSMPVSASVPRDKTNPREACREWVDELRYSWISRHLRGALSATLVPISVSKPAPLAQVVGSLVSAVGAKPDLTPAQQRAPALNLKGQLTERGSGIAG